MTEWKKYTLDEVCSHIFSGGTPSTTKKEYWNGDINWLSSGETGNKYISRTERKITQLGVDNSTTKLAQKGCTVVASAGQGFTRGQTSFLLIDTYVNQSVIVFEANENIIDKKFLYYNLANRYEEFRLLSDGTSTRGGLSGWIVKRMEISLPPLPTQKKIAEVLSCLDAKIELNRRINENLEQQAGAIFKEWFVDNAKPEWKVGKLGNIIEVKYGKDHKKLSEGTIPVFGSGGIMRYVDKSLYDKESVLIPRKGTLNNIIYVNKPFWSVDTMFYSQMKKANVAKFVYFYLKALDLASMNAGSAVPSMTTEILNRLEFKMPDDLILQKYDNITTSLFAGINKNNKENKTLAQIRDSLLPKLMSGEIEV